MNRVLAGCFTASVLFSLAVDVQAETRLIKAARAYTGEGKTLEPAAILVVDGKIESIGEHIEAGDDVEVTDFGEHVIIPGLINAYSHAGVEGTPSEFTREVTSAYRVDLAVDWQSLEFRQLRESGVTTIGLTPGTDNVFAGNVSVVKTGGDLPERLVSGSAGLAITVASDARNRNRARVRPDSIFVRQPTNRMGVVWIARSTFDRVRQGELQDTAVAQVLEGERRLYCVSRTHFDIESALRLADEFGFEPIVVGGHEAHKLTDELAERKTKVILGPLTSATVYGAERTDAMWNRAGLLHDAGIPVALTGDELLRQARFAIRYGLPAEAALQAITRVPAELLGVSNRVGSLSAGKDADLVVLSGEPFEFTTRITAVVINGNLHKEG